MIYFLLSAIFLVSVSASTLRLEGEDSAIYFGDNKECEIKLTDGILVSSCEFEYPPDGACPDFKFDGTGLNDDKCPTGWICDKPFSAGNGGCNGDEGVYVASYALTIAQCNNCMDPGTYDGRDDHLFKIAWDNRCGEAHTEPFVLPEGTAKVKFLVGGGADQGGMWVTKAEDGSELCEYKGPPQCPMADRTCDFTSDVGGMLVVMKLEKPCEGSGGWENLVFDNIRFMDSNDQELQLGCASTA
jgi:hypothetical protein